MELKGDDGDNQPNDDVDHVDQVVAGLTEMRAKLFSDVSTNIKHAQKIYKEYYDKRREGSKVHYVAVYHINYAIEYI